MNLDKETKMRKTLILFIAVIFSLAIFSACGSAGARSPDVAVNTQKSVNSDFAVVSNEESPVGQVIPKRRRLCNAALQTDVKTGAGTSQNKGSVRLANFVIPDISGTTNYRPPDERFTGFGADCSARAKI